MVKATGGGRGMGAIAAHLRYIAGSGRPKAEYLDQPPQSAEALEQLAALPAGAADRLREYLHGDYLILYTVATPGHWVHLLSIRHHRELSFQFFQLWAGPAGSPER